MINLVLTIVILALATFTAVRGVRSPIVGLIDAVFTVLIVFLLARGMSWNTDLPVFVWWLLALWGAALVGFQAARVVARPQSPGERRAG
ncbi:hypothetical protein M3G18_06195 [Corynebacterium sp. p3-SID1145]|uniref:hypothetical protein n=1 Tax=unclassified Corynebacterium TaxID=2624378 RepID=UPI0021AAC8AE|nr:MULTISPECIES: hypothetical protein [unclassified Corynebacterium]MCT1452499.1 hypothetical protein [Corynebacterium sp. p3-SID1145]MCT1461401.1 hypothetical protein [Corynebacterium sp. p3-SID1140]